MFKERVTGQLVFCNNFRRVRADFFCKNVSSPPDMSYNKFCTVRNCDTAVRRTGRKIASMTYQIHKSSNISWYSIVLFSHHMVQ